jgi:hypothetical protein
MVDDKEFELVTSTVGAQKEEKAENIRDYPSKPSRFRGQKSNFADGH